MKHRIPVVLLLALAFTGCAAPPLTSPEIQSLTAEAANLDKMAADAEARKDPDAPRLRKLADLAKAQTAELNFLITLRKAELNAAAKPAEIAALRTVRGREIHRLPVEGTYAVVVSLDTYKSDWIDVVRALVVKYDARVVIYAPGTSDWAPALARLGPKYACFVARPTEIGFSLPANIHDNIRKLDADPLVDAIWAILTGADAASAFNVAANEKPLLVQKGMGGCYQGIDWAVFDQWMWWYEGNDANSKQKLADGREVKRDTTFDNAHEIINELNTFQPDMFFTSGHGNHNAWEIGYGVNRGMFISKGGTVYGANKARKKLALNSPNPKIYVPFGNCLIGRVEGPDSMVPSWIKSGGACHVAGYTVERSNQNRGVSESLLAAFFTSGGRYTFSEAYFLSTVGTGGLEQKRGFALYGDPAWDARLKPRKPLTTWTIAEQNGTYTVTIDAPEPGDYQQYLFLPHWLKNYEPVSGKDHVDFTADNYISVHGRFDKGKSTVAVFKAKRVIP